MSGRPSDPVVAEAVQKPVLMVSSYGPPHPGGLETVAELIFRAVRDGGMPVRWLMSDVPRREADDGTVRVPAINFVERLTGVPIPVPTFRGVGAIMRAVRESRAVHVHDMMYLCSWIAVVAARVWGKPWAVTLHVWKVPYRSWAVKRLQDLAHVIGSLICLWGAEWISYYNRRFRAQLERYGAARVLVVPNAIHPAFLTVPLERLAEMRELTRAAIGWRQGEGHVIFAARMVEKKGLAYLREVAASRPDLRFHLCGSGPENPAAWRLENCQVHGHLGKVDLAQFFIAGDLLLLPSVGEGFPLSVQEAMACGLPCAIFRETWEAWGRDPEYFMLLDGLPGKPRWGEDLARLNGDAMRRARAGYAREAWSEARFASAYVRLYEQLIGTRSVAECDGSGR